MITKGPDARYATRNWWPWFAQGREVLGHSREKARVVEIRLRRVTPRVFWRIIRLGWCNEADLSGADHNEYTIWPKGFKVPV
ncbi:MAG: hypothetical protein GF334_04405 [Candidatus Altiarchaeales archaeon]|nr:hypothetical protein [Candidatus Altiarchaeales archaeon]